MTTFNELTTQDTVVSSDQVPIYSTTNGQPRKASALALATFTASNLPTATIAGNSSVGGNLTVVGSAALAAVSGTRFTFTPQGSAPAYAKGNVWYDATAEALSVQDDISGTSIQLGHETILKVRNTTGSTIVNGSAVYINGATGQIPTIALAKADAAATSRLVGIATHDIANNTNGKITIYGVVNDLNTSAFSEGATVYLSATVAGAFTATAPTGVNQRVTVGVIASSHVSTGKLVVISLGALSSPDLATPPPIGNTTPNTGAFSAVAVNFVDSTSTPGNVTNNSARGRVAFGAGASTVVVTNSLATAASMIIVTLRAPDTALTSILRVLPTAGSFTITANAASTGTAAQADFLVVN